jgi:hypothetical protein
MKSVGILNHRNILFNNFRVRLNCRTETKKRMKRIRLGNLTPIAVAKGIP